MSQPDESSLHTKSNSGRWTVVAMFGFAFTMIALLFTYWEFYTAPFRELQYAIADAYPGSSPRVVGGQHKSHKEGFPKILRVVVYIPPKEFNPETEEDRSEARAAKLARLAFKHQDVSEYAQLDIVLLQKVPEGARRRWITSKSIEEWEPIVQE